MVIPLATQRYMLLQRNLIYTGIAGEAAARADRAIKGAGATSLFADTLSSSDLSGSGDPCPIQTKPSPMPAHDGSRSDQDERLCPPGPERSQRDPEQFVQGRQSMARSIGVQGQQLLPESQIFKHEILPATESADHPAEDIPERHNHG